MEHRFPVILIPMPLKKAGAANFDRLQLAGSPGQSRSRPDGKVLAVGNLNHISQDQDLFEPHLPGATTASTTVPVIGSAGLLPRRGQGLHSRTVEVQAQGSWVPYAWDRAIESPVSVGLGDIGWDLGGRFVCSFWEDGLRMELSSVLEVLCLRNRDL